MKTLVFHSVKGGVGRTLALCNVARALTDIGKRVLMLDFDYEAPGLHYKFGRQPAPGYMEYLEEFGVEARTSDVAESKRWRSLKRNIEAIDDKLHLLRAGDESSADFWRFISSYPFHRLFYTARKEVSGLNPAAFPLDWLDRNIRAFEADKQLIEKHFAPDYLLVDCKTFVLTSQFFLLDWADTVIHFSPANAEGIQYACGTAAALVRHMANEAGEHRRIGFIPVVSRVPNRAEEADQEQHRNVVKGEWRRKNWKGNEANIAADFFQTEDFVFLSETSQIEAQERILFEQTDPERDHLWQLSHEYLSLCARSVPQLDEKCLDRGKDWWSENETWWYGQRKGMDPDARIRAKEFDNYPHRGVMFNEDAEPNIAMRIRTFHLMMGEVLGSALPDNSEAQQEILRQSGRRCGEDFGRELNETFKRKDSSSDLQRRLESWAKFDSRVGFGTIRVLDMPTNHSMGWLLVVGDAFAKREDSTRDLRGFFEGYAEGVLTELYRAMDKKDSCAILVSGVDEPSEHAKRLVIEKELQALPTNSYYEFSEKASQQP